jgi:hypothetical protein
MVRPFLRKFMQAALAVIAMVFVAFVFQNCAQSLPGGAGSSSQSGYGTLVSAPGKSCKEILQVNPSSPTAAYYIDPDGKGAGVDPFQVYCDMTTDGGGWMLVARNDQTTTFTAFDRPWVDYKNGFGNLEGHGLGWLGNERLHAVTAAQPVVLKVVDDVRAHLYGQFSVDTEANNYKLGLVDAPATSADGGYFVQFNGVNFTTWDRDNDTYPDDNCAEVYHTGWWYTACYAMTIAGSDMNQVYWRDSAGAVEPAAFIEMWVR